MCISCYCPCTTLTKQNICFLPHPPTHPIIFYTGDSQSLTSNTTVLLVFLLTILSRTDLHLVCWVKALRTSVLDDYPWSNSEYRAAQLSFSIVGSCSTTGRCSPSSMFWASCQTIVLRTPPMGCICVASAQTSSTSKGLDKWWFSQTNTIGSSGHQRTKE